MKKILLLSTILLFRAYSFAYEYTDDYQCVYEINVGDQTASVVNFYSNASVVTIPSSFMYKGDRYIVTGLGYKDFETRVRNDWFGNSVIETYGKYSYEDYEESRANIVELNLPNTLKKISYNAFKGMTRLKRIVIPASVENTEDFDSWFNKNSRLENITFMGMLYYKKSKQDGGYYDYYKICLIDAPDPIATLDSLKNELKKSYCPNLKTIEVVPLKESLQYKNKWNNLYNMYSKRLQDTVSIYEAKLSEHPYYIKEDYFNSISISKPEFKGDKPKEEYSTLSSKLKKEYNNQIKACRERYKKLNSEMEQICKEQQPELYANCYYSLHPDFSAKIDSMYYDYKCDYTKQGFILAVLDDNVKGGNCHEELWRQYSYLYKSQEHFLMEYDRSLSVRQDIGERKNIYNTLRNHIRYSKISTKGFYDKKDSKHIVDIKIFRKAYDKMKEYEIPVTIEIINQDTKAQREFEKNGKYFNSPDEFFAAYITSNYKDILKAQKKAKK